MRVRPPQKKNVVGGIILWSVKYNFTLNPSLASSNYGKVPSAFKQISSFKWKKWHVKNQTFQDIFNHDFSEGQYNHLLFLMWPTFWLFRASDSLCKNEIVYLI